MKIPLPSPVLHEENCVGCLECMKACAIHHLGDDKDLEHVCFKIFKEGDSFHVKCCFECGKCAEVCPNGAIQKNRMGIYRIDAAKCNRCGKCVAACPYGTIHLVPEKTAAFKCERCGACVKACEHKVIGHKLQWVKIF